MNTRKLLIFDYDGTIVDSLDPVFKLYNEHSARYNLPAMKDKEAFRALFDQNVLVSIREMGFSTYQIYSFSRKIKKFLIEHAEEFLPFEGMPEVIRSLKKSGYSLAVISSNHQGVVKHFLHHYGLDKQFDQVVGGERRKSKTDRINSLASRLNVVKDNVYYIGDTTGDMKEAKAAGVHAVAVSWGYQSKEVLTTTSPDFIADTPKDLLIFLS